MYLKQHHERRPTMTMDQSNEIEATDSGAIHGGDLGTQSVRQGGGAMTNLSELLLSVEEAADVLRIGRTRTYELVMTRKIRSVKVGRRRLVVGSSLVDFVQTLLQEQEFG
jgi:excisionase family DNA binding protein